MGTGSGGSKSDSFTRKEASSLSSPGSPFSDIPQLRDIFRIHPDTACHTHELLDCRCDDPENDESPNDGPSATDEAVDDLDSDLDEDDMKLVKTFQAASQLKPEQMDRMDKAVRSISYSAFIVPA
jgi:DNA repair and recombination protein RAD54B